MAIRRISTEYCQAQHSIGADKWAERPLGDHPEPTHPCPAITLASRRKAYGSSNLLFHLTTAYFSLFIFFICDGKNCMGEISLNECLIDVETIGHYISAFFKLSLLNVMWGDISWMLPCIPQKVLTILTSLNWDFAITEIIFSTCKYIFFFFVEFFKYFLLWIFFRIFLK